MSTCAGNKGTVEGCEAAAITSSGYCYHHAPELREVRQHNARKGGRSGGRGRPSGRKEARQVRKLVRNIIEELTSENGVSLSTGMYLRELIECLRIYTKLIEHDRDYAADEGKLDTDLLRKNIDQRLQWV